MDGHGAQRGGIFEFARQCVEHRAELAADFRSFYSTPLHAVQGAEFAHLVRALLGMPESRFHAAVVRWDHPISRAAMYQLDLIDVLLMRWAGDKFKPVHRPWSTQRPGGKKRTASEALRILRPHQFKQGPPTLP